MKIPGSLTDRVSVSATGRIAFEKGYLPYGISLFPILSFAALGNNIRRLILICWFLIILFKSKYYFFPVVN
ncbi:hypothetical protein C1I38_12540 [Dehalobacter sp. 12DCB1]|nr:hypothetical protein C1I36_09740 [Dehalobacter sp. 14DCB1]TCX50219.1 hypothetical protein C1I38_12540 [Dehalobacter sp. 12DCB1]